MNTYTVSILLSLVFCSGCCIANRTKTKTKTVIDIDTTILIKPNPEIKKSISFESLINFDTLKIETEKNLISVYFIPENPITEEPEKIEVVNKEKEFSKQITFKQEKTETISNIQKPDKPDKTKLIWFFIFVFGLYVFYRLIKLL
jgi:hypothetical protein